MARRSSPTLGGMLELLHFAYFQAMGLWVVPYALIGLFFTAIAATKVKGCLRMPCVALVLALFFSLSFAVGRIAVPVPTLFLVGWWATDIVQRAVNSPACQPSSEGCVPPDEGGALILVPFLIQWLLFYAILVATRASWGVIVKIASQREPTRP
jgi:hypothetical protein